MTPTMLEMAGIVLAVAVPLVMVPLTVITFYLRSMREHQLAGHADLVRRGESAEAAIGELRRRLAEMERDYTSKEEWLRECMHARRLLEKLTEASVRHETLLADAAAVERIESGE